MQHDEFVATRDTLNAACEAALLQKGADYTLSGDRLDNFKRVAAMAGCTPLQVWAVYFLKHVFAILKYTQGAELQSEPIWGRFLDARNYIDLGCALAMEASHERAEVVPVPIGGGADQ